MNFNVLEIIRENIFENLQNCKTELTKLFFIENYKPNKFDFHKLEQSLISDFPELKRSALILSMCSTSEEMIKLKAKQLRKLIWLDAGISAGIALYPLPGLSFLYDASTAITSAKFYYLQCGLNDESLEKHAKLTSTDPQTLKRIVNEAFGTDFVTIQGIKVILQSALCAAAIAANAFEGLSNFIASVGSLIAAPLSFKGTFIAHQRIIDAMESVALRVVISNYRPIALTSLFSQIMERVVASEMSSYMLQHGLINKQQHGFLNKKSTSTNLVESLYD